jgi:hypothetical protein
MSGFEDAFGVPAGHSLRLVRSAASPRVWACGRAGAEARWWEHEEYDEHGRLVAVYESWTQERDGGGGGRGLAFVKYSPYGWVLSVSGRSARLPPPRTIKRPLVEAS